MALPHPMYELVPPTKGFCYYCQSEVPIYAAKRELYYPMYSHEEDRGPFENEPRWGWTAKCRKCNGKIYYPNDVRDPN